MTVLFRDRCNRCRFWLEDIGQRDPADADWGFGSCRRRPPTIVDTAARAMMPRPDYFQQTEPETDTVHRQVATWFPATFATDWCGEFENRQGEVPVA